MEVVVGDSVDELDEVLVSVSVLDVVVSVVDELMLVSDVDSDVLDDTVLEGTVVIWMVGGMEPFCGIVYVPAVLPATKVVTVN